jgi:hypothetical protein
LTWDPLCIGPGGTAFSISPIVLDAGQDHFPANSFVRSVPVHTIDDPKILQDPKKTCRHRSSADTNWRSRFPNA